MPAAIRFSKGEKIPGTRLFYQDEAVRTDPKRRRASFLCECGNAIEMDLNWVRFGNVTSCGCFKSEVVAATNAKHGAAVRGKMTGAYRSWQAMHQRVLVRPEYSHVGVCERWSGENGFENFLADMGERPKNHTIERRDNAKGYEPANCIWATKHVQAQNQRHTARVTIGAETHSIAEWCRRKGISYSMVKQRRQRGMSVEDAILTPLNESKRGRRHD